MRLHHLLIVGVLISLGCGGAPADRSHSMGGQNAGGKKAAAPEARQQGAPAAKDERGPAAPKEVEAVARKIIYTANLSLIVEDFDQAQKALMELVEEHKGYIAKSETFGAPGKRRSGNWTVRVPEPKFRSFMTACEALGEPERSVTDSQDVTEEFYDLEGRIKNKKVEEDRLIELMKKSTGRLDEVLAVGRELSRVQGEIEQAQGRLQKLSKLAELATVTITLQDRKDYVPPASPSFGTSIGRTFEGSLGALTSLGKWLVLIVVALAPWLPLLAAVGVAIWLLVRYIRAHWVEQPLAVRDVVDVEPLPPGMPE